MKNFEKYEPEILAIPAKSTLFNLIDFFQNHGCSTVYEGLQWLYQEDEPFTEEEKIILKNIRKDFKWIARDYDGKLCLYEVEPRKNSGVYSSFTGKFCYFSVYKHLFKNVTFEGGPVQFRGDDND